MYCKYDTPEMIEAVFDAVAAEETENLRFYIMDGADPDLRNKNGLTLLQEAAKSGKTAAAHLLLSMGADADAKTETTGHTALHYAACNDNRDMIALLAAAGAELNAPDQFKWTPLHMAADHGAPAALDALLVAGADASLRDEKGRRPLDIARQKYEAMKQPVDATICRRLGMAEEIANADSLQKDRVNRDLDALRAKRPQKRLGR